MKYDDVAYAISKYTAYPINGYKYIFHGFSLYLNNIVNPRNAITISISEIYRRGVIYIVIGSLDASYVPSTINSFTNDDIEIDFI